MKVKAIILGDSGVGKSTLLSYTRKDRRVIPTIGVDCFVYKCLQIWDTSGAERFRMVIERFYGKMDMVVLVYNSISSLASIEEYRRDVCKVNKNVKWLVIYNGNNENMIRQGHNYCRMYDMAYLNGDFSKDGESSRIIKNMRDYACPESKVKGWRYCWIY